MKMTHPTGAIGGMTTKCNWYPRLDPGTEKVHQGNPNKMWNLVNSSIPMLVPWL